MTKTSARLMRICRKIKGQLNKRKYKNVDYAIDQIKKMLDGHGNYGKLFHVILDGEERRHDPYLGL